MAKARGRGEIVLFAKKAGGNPDAMNSQARMGASKSWGGRGGGGDINYEERFLMGCIVIRGGGGGDKKD